MKVFDCMDAITACCKLMKECGERKLLLCGTNTKRLLARNFFVTQYLVKNLRGLAVYEEFLPASMPPPSVANEGIKEKESAVMKTFAYYSGAGKYSVVLGSSQYGEGASLHPMLRMGKQTKWFKPAP